MLFWVRAIVRHRALVLIGLLLISVLSAVSLRDAVIATSIQRMLLGESEAHLSYQRRAAVFGGDEMVVIAYDDDAPLSLASLGRLERAVERIAALDAVGEVRSLLDPVAVTEEGGVLTMDPYAERVRADPSQQAALTASLEAEPTVQGLLRADSGAHSALVVTLRPDASRPSEVGPEVMAAAVDILNEEGFTGLRRAGVLATVAGVLEETSRNLTRLFPLAFVAVVVSVYALFRRLLPVLVATAVSGLAVLWTMGFSVRLDPEINLFSAVVPAVILVVAISDSIHLWSAYLIELSEGASKEEAIERSATEVGRACLLTSATTFLGFISLCLIPTPLYRQVGLVLGVGVGIALLITITLMPALMSYLSAPAVPPRRERADDWTETLAALTTRHAWPLVVGFGAVTAVLLFGVSQIRLEADLMSRMAPSSTLSQENDFIRTQFSGSNLMEVFVDAPEGLATPGLLPALEGYQDWLRAQPEVDTVYSVVDLVGGVHTALTGETSVPTDPAAAAQYLLLVEMSGPDALAPLVNFERTTLRLVARLSTGEFRRSHDIARLAEQEAARRLGPAVGVEATGLNVLFGGFIDDLVNGQRNGLLFSLLAIAAMMAAGLRSVRNGIVSMLPNLLPLLAVGGGVGLAWTFVDSDVALVAMIAIGIGVDDTIHFLVRLKLEAARAPLPDAVRRTFRYAGRGIVFTTIILTLGFLPMALSDYFSIWIMGTLLPGALIVALVADLLLVPALAAVGAFRF